MVGGKGGKVLILFDRTHTVVRDLGRSGREVRPQLVAYRTSSVGGNGGRISIGHIVQPRCVRVLGRAGRALIRLKEMSSAFKRFGRELVISEILLKEMSSISRELGREQSNTLRPILCRLRDFRAV